MIELSPTTESLYDRLIRLKPAGLSTRAWTINAGVSSGFFDSLAAGTAPRDGDLPKVLAVVGMTLAEFEGRQRPRSGAAPVPPLPTLRVMPRPARSPAETAAIESTLDMAGLSDPDGSSEAETPADDKAPFAEATAEAVQRWLEARRQAEAAGLDTGGSDGIRLVGDLARLALDLECAPGRAQSSRANETELG
jgi:hypothetical protein